MEAGASADMSAPLQHRYLETIIGNQPICKNQVFSLCLCKAAFGDFAPYLICSEASLDALNEELPSPVTMERFRANIVINGLEAWEEVSFEGGHIKPIWTFFFIQSYEYFKLD